MPKSSWRTTLEAGFSGLGFSGLGFGYWGVMAIVRPESLYGNFRKRAAHAVRLPKVLDWWLSSRACRVEMRIWGTISLVVSLALLWFLARDLLGLAS